MTPGASENPFRFVLIHWCANNHDLRKEAGRIPSHLHRIFGWRTELWAYANPAEARRRRGWGPHPGDGESDYANQRQTPGVNLRLWQDRGQVARMFERSLLGGLWREAAGIDALMVIHLLPSTLFLGVFYRLRNPHGVLVVKCDGASYWQASRPWKNAFFRVMESVCLACFDFITVETPDALGELRRVYPAAARKMILVPNGHDSHRPATLAPVERENLVLTTGRIGVAEKNHEFLVEAFAQARLPGWRLALVGPRTAEFDQWLEAAAFPDLRARLDLPGHVGDEEGLTRWYARAKIFCLTSRYESFGFSLLEAAAAGAMIVATPVGSAPLLTAGGALGELLPDGEPATLARVLEKWAARPGELAERGQRQRTFVAERFSWRAIVGELGRRIHGRARSAAAGAL